MTGRRIITRDMIIAARDKGWTVSLTAAHYGMHRSSIAAACDRFGIALPFSKFAPTVPSRTKPKPENQVSDKRTPAIWSCSPAAIQRALEAAGRHAKKITRGATHPETVTGGFVFGR